MCFNTHTKILSIHHYDSEYSHIDYQGLVLLQRYIDHNVVGSLVIRGDTTKSKVYLKRNLKMMKNKRKHNNDIILRQRMIHKIVLLNNI